MMKILLLFIICASYGTCCFRKTSEIMDDVKKEFVDIGHKVGDGFEKAEKAVVDEFNDVEPKVSDGVKKFETEVVKEFTKVGDEIVAEYKKMEIAVEEGVDVIKKLIMGACKCVDYDCGCCAHLVEPKIDLNSTICTNLTYLVKDYGISFTVTVNNYAIINETVSARNPPPMCLGVPYVKDLAAVCIRLYDINATSSYLHVCIRIEARMKTILVAKYDFGCVNMGPPRLSFVAEPPQHILETTERVSPVELSVAMDSVEETSALPVIASVVGILLVLVIAIGVFLGLRKRRGEQYRRLWIAKNQYGSTQSLASHIDPYC